MKIVAMYDFNGGKQRIQEQYSMEFQEIKAIIASINASSYKTKYSNEKTMMGQRLFAPKEINEAFRQAFENAGWSKHRVACEYIFGEYLENYVPIKPAKGAFREMDFVKTGKKLGVEVQLGKYAFMVYNVCAKKGHFVKWIL